MISELVKYLKHRLFDPIAMCSICIVRKYETKCGWVGEIYVNNEFVGMSCENVVDSNIACVQAEMCYKNGVRTIVFKDSSNISVRFLRRGFDSFVPCDVIAVGSLDPKLNDSVLAVICDKAQNKLLNISLYERIAVEF